MHDPPLVIPDILYHSAPRFGGKTALQMKGKGAGSLLTYASLLKQSERLGFYLREEGFARSEKAAILCESRPEWAVVYFGILMAGGVAVPIDTKLHEKEIDNILDHSETRVLFTSDRLGSAEVSRKVISVDSDEFASALSRHSRGEGIEAEPQDLAMLVYTSGTTGSPKAVMLTHSNIVSNVIASYAAIPAKPTDSFLSVLPLNHLLELTGGLLGPLYAGATVNYLSEVSTAAIQRTMRETGTTIMIGVPLMFRIMLNKVFDRIEESIQPAPFIFSFNMRMARASRKLRIGRLLLRWIRWQFGGRVRYFISGGAPLDREVDIAFQCMGMPILQGYGLTETSPVVSVNTRKSHRLGSVGKPLAGVKVRISEDGEILVSGPNVMRGYYKDAETTSSVLIGGELHTGDIGSFDADGFLYITGRKKNLIVTATGKKVYPEKIEATIGSSPFISDICIVGRKENGGEKPFAFVIPDYDHFGKLGLERDIETVTEVIRNDVKNLSSALPDYMRVSNFTIFKGEFPKTTTRKIRRSELSRLADEWRPVVRRPSSMDGFAERLRSLVAVTCQLREEDISLESDLYMDLGVDSLLKVEILAAVEEELGVTVPDEVSHRISSFGELVDISREYTVSRSGHHPALEEDEEPYEFLKERSVLRNFAKRTLALIFRVVSRWYFGLEVKGARHVEGLESFIITPNHNSLLDVPVVLSSLPRRVAEGVFSPAAKDYFYDRHPFRRWLITLVFDSFPFDRYGNFAKALKRCKYTISQGKSLILFPEGTRSVSGQLLPFKIGLAALALDLGIPIVPTYMKGIHEAFGKGMLLPRPGKIEVRFGEPIHMDRYESGKATMRKYDIYKKIMEDLREEMLRLMRGGCVH